MKKMTQAIEEIKLTVMIKVFLRESKFETYVYRQK